jgi:hypothetical protein
MVAGSLLVCAGLAGAQDPAAGTASNAAEAETLPPPPMLADYAGQADFIGLVQVLDTDYEYQREFPSGGTAFLRVLIPYKTNRPVPDIIELYEEGLHEHECYFPNASPAEEGRRYLLFARDNPEVEEQFLGLEQGCALTVLVTADNSYALQYPLDGLEVSDELDELAAPTDFADAYAILDYENLAVDRRNSLLEAGYLEERDDRTYKVTYGISLAAFRELIGEENLTRDRTLLRPAPDPFDLEN